ncbi:MAG: ankyrin repeat domain-containing protein [Myxococcota bacterium]
MSDAVVHAAWEGERATVQQLIGADPALVDATGEVPTWDGALTPLLAAAIRGHTPIIELLAQAGATFPNNAVTLAIGEGHHDTADALVRLGAPVDACAAAGMRDTQVLQKLLSHDPSQAKGSPGQATPLHYAATPAHVDLLLHHGADLDARDDYHGNTPFTWALSNGARREAVRDRLRARGCALDVFDRVALGDDAEVMRILTVDPDTLDRRAPAHDLHAYGGPLLHAAVRYGRETLVDALLAKGADVGLRGQEPLQATALHWAAFHDQPGCVHRLLDAGADPTLTDASWGVTPFAWAEHNGSAAASRAFESRGIRT